MRQSGYSVGSGNGQFGTPTYITISSTAPANCTLPWGGTLNTGFSVYAYNASSATPPASCPAANTLSCLNGTLTCTLSGGGTGPVTPNCEYQTCTLNCTLPWGGTIGSGNSVTAYQAASVAYPTTCSSQSRTCTNGTLSGTYAFQSCTETGQPCTLPWGGSINDTQTVTAYQSATEAAAGSSTCVNSQTRTCNNGTLSGTYGNQSCAVTCSLTSNQGGGVLYVLIANGPTSATEYTNSSAATCPSHTMTCAAAGLSCSTGVMSDRTYNSCTTSVCPSTSQFRIYGSAANVQAGYSVAVGDVNGDGTKDLIIGAPGANSGAGAVYVVFGTNAGFPDPITLSSLNGTTGFVLNGSAAGAKAGSAVAAGDVNGDGIADIIIGAPNATISANTNVGSVYVVFGKSSAWAASSTLNAAFLNGTTGVEYDGNAATGGQFTGNSVATGDINGDGKQDIIIGAYGVTIGGVQVNAGATYVVFGKAAGSWPTSATSLNSTLLNGTNGFEVDGTTSGQDYGFSVASGDVNGDGIADLLIGGYGANATQGSFAVVFGKSSGWSGTAYSIGTTFLNGTNGALFSGPNTSDQIGWSIAAGDVNGDGKADIIVGGNTATYGASQFYTGKVDIIFGKGGAWSSSATSLTSAFLNGTNGVDYYGPAASAYTGTSVASADVNGDGKSDILIGSYNNNSGNGSAFIVFGMGSGWPSSSTVLNGTYLNGTNGVEYDGGFSGGWVGSSIAAGDVNKDTVADIVIGAPDASPSNNSKAGAVYTVFGRSSGCGTNPWPTTATNLDPQTIPYLWATDPGNSRVEKFNMSGSYVSQFGSAGSGNGQFASGGGSPNGVAVDSNGNVWVGDGPNNRIEEFNSSGSYLSQFTATNLGMIAIDSGNHIWVSGIPVNEYNTSGSLLLSFGSSGSGNGQFNSPNGIGIDSGGNVWVVDTGNNRVQKFNSSGSFLLIAGGPCGHSCGNGQFNRPLGMAVDASDNIWVADNNNQRVQEFNSAGSFLAAPITSLSITRNVAIDSSGNIWVSYNAVNFKEFNTAGSLLAGPFGGGGTGNGQFNSSSLIGQMAIH